MRPHYLHCQAVLKFFKTKKSAIIKPYHSILRIEFGSPNIIMLAQFGGNSNCIFLETCITCYFEGSYQSTHIDLFLENPPTSRCFWHIFLPQSTQKVTALSASFLHTSQGTVLVSDSPRDEVCFILSTLVTRSRSSESCTLLMK